MKIGFIGIGHMGEGMARNLMQAGHQLTIYNRTRSKTERLRAEGAAVADSPAQAAAAAEVLITMLADDDAVGAAVLNGYPGQPPAIEGLQRDAIHMCTSTISVAMSRELEAAHKPRGQQYVASPVLGRPEAAAQRQLWLIAAGPQPAVERCRPILEALGRGFSVVASEPWKANLMKLGVNFMLASLLESIGEAFALVEKAGADVRQFLEVMNNGTFRSPLVENYGNRIIEKRYEPAGFSMRLGFKDVRLAMQSAIEETVPMPLTGLLSDHYLHALAHGHGELDWSAIAEVSRQAAGLTKTLRAGG
ncbi:MAG: 3-hydroxyisobutyrate dehydrogenase [Bryobacterales bacterium]|jgi:3-hydroxyisobutyrate dehydrogenase-like beta-hydroxyacid dehydrogenase|nr:3-hydroxyisobutyrate dehydrogenase [Bryobacterales bacterium]